MLRQCRRQRPAHLGCHAWIDASPACIARPPRIRRNREQQAQTRSRKHDVHVRLATRPAARKDGEVIPEFFMRRWQAAGLIDDATTERIAAWETSHRRPVWLWAVAGMGALAIGLGVMAVIGANWEGIPAWAKLAVVLALNVLCSVALFGFL